MEVHFFFSCFMLLLNCFKQLAMFEELNTNVIGKTISKLRKHREVKAAEIASHLKMAEQAYTKYERGETSVTLHFLNKVSQFFDVNPIHFLVNGPETIVENIHNQTGSVPERELVLALQKQIAEKDRQIEQHLAIIRSITQNNRVSS